MITVVSVVDGAYYAGPYTSGSTVNVTLTDGMHTVTCEGILIWEEDSLEEIFEEWMELAAAGEEGYTVK